MFENNLNLKLLILYVIDLLLLGSKIENGNLFKTLFLLFEKHWFYCINKTNQNDGNWLKFVISIKQIKVMEIVWNLYFYGQLK